LALNDDNGARSPKTKQQIEAQLLEELRRHKKEWVTASDDNREAARERFMDALNVFNSFVIYGKLSDDSNKR
jgi:hypothetical protein